MHSLTCVSVVACVASSYARVQARDHINLGLWRTLYKGGGGSLPSGVEDSDSASYSEVVWAKSARGVLGLANVFANGKLYFTGNVLEANCLPRVLESPAKHAAKHAPKAKSGAKPTA